jgi:hypothetical protein
MADWYVSSTAYAAISAFVASHAYSIGDIVKPTAPAQSTRWAFRCTTAGTSGTEPTWQTSNNGTVTTGGATFTNVTGQSTYFWAAAAGDHQTLNGTTGIVRYAAGDRVFISSDHAETVPGGTAGSGSTLTQGFGLLQFLCVNRAGSTPPAAADLTTGATISASASLFLPARVNTYYQGLSFIQTSNNVIQFAGSSPAVEKTGYFKNCTFFANTANAGSFYVSVGQRIIFDNTTLQFGHTGQAINIGGSELQWVNTPSAIAGSIFPTVLFNHTASSSLRTYGTLRGADLSAVTGTLVANVGTVASCFLFDSCRIASSVTRFSGNVSTADIVELVNCFDGTNIINESYQTAGSVVTERTITLSGGATDDVGTFSHKLVSGTNVDKWVNPLFGFWMDVENTVVGSSKTATVEIISSLTLNNDDVSLLLEYQGTSGSSVGSFANTLPTNVLTTNAAVTASTATWNSSPATPVKQKLVVTFTPRQAGRVRGQVRLGRASTTVYVNPIIAIA